MWLEMSFLEKRLSELPERNRKRFKQIAKKNGREAAITAMKKQLGKT